MRDELKRQKYDRAMDAASAKIDIVLEALLDIIDSREESTRNRLQAIKTYLEVAQIHRDRQLESRLSELEKLIEIGTNAQNFRSAIEEFRCENPKTLSAG